MRFGMKIVFFANPFIASKDNGVQKRNGDKNNNLDKIRTERLASLNQFTYFLLCPSAIYPPHCPLKRENILSEITLFADRRFHND